MRLTERFDVITAVDKSGIEYHSKGIAIKDKQLAEKKLCQIEDIEDELGIDLITLFKALKNGVYYFTNSKQITKDYVWLIDNYISIGTRNRLSYSFMTAFERQLLVFIDYGKTWALTKEELENEK